MPVETESIAYPFVQFVVKVASRCDLSCDHCYVYEMADSGWRRQPPLMAPDTVDATAARIAEHLDAHDLTGAQVVLHGGEPLLAGPERIAAIATTLHSATAGRVNLRLQTNGTRLTDRMVEVLREWRISVSVSVDGGRRAHDRHRRYADGRGSFDTVAAAVDRLRDRAPELFAGLLCTIDLANDPLEVYNDLLAFAPPVIDFLLPHGNWTSPPPGRVSGGTDTPYGTWLAEIFDQWYGETPRTVVRSFAEILNLLFGGHSAVETLGLSPVRLIVVDTDGGLEQVDTLKSAYDGAAATGLNVFDHPFDAALAHPDILARQRGAAGLCRTCRECPLHPVCGGGLYTHRYRAGAGFDNPSVFCPDLAFLIGHVQGRVSRDVSALETHP